MRSNPNRRCMYHGVCAATPRRRSETFRCEKNACSRHRFTESWHEVSVIRRRDLDESIVIRARRDNRDSLAQKYGIPKILHKTAPLAFPQ